MIMKEPKFDAFSKMDNPYYFEKSKKKILYYSVCWGFSSHLISTE